MSDQASAVEGGDSLGHGRYVLQRLLGQGGMASVHLAYDTVLDRQVAVKTLHSELGREASFKERFRREAQAVARLQHTNIVSVFDSGEDIGADGVGTPYIVMEYVEGKALRDVLNEDTAQYGAMPTDRALKVTAEVLAALEEAHDHELVHRDIKPGNVMVSTKGVVKVMDFGIARALQSGVTSMTQTGMVVGTPQYLSPEQALGKSVDARSDLYSVGCMLFELLTGGLPFEGDSAFSIAYKHVQEEPPAPSSLNQAVPPAVDALVARALRKDPAHRFPSAAAMREEIERISAGGGQAATPLVISEGPRSVHASPSMAGFPPVGPEVHTPQPQLQQPYQPGPATPPPGYQPGPATPPPYAPGYQQAPATPPPYLQTPPPGYQQGPATPPPYPQYQTPAPFPQAAPTPAPFPQQRPPMPGPYVPPPAKPSGNGCSTALIVVGVIVGVIVLAIVIVMISVVKSHQTTSDYSGTSRPATTLWQQQSPHEQL